VHATTLAAGCRTAISWARLGPDTTATRSGATPATSTMTSLIRRVEPSSTPFIRLTSGADGGSRSRHRTRLARSVCEGTASTTTSAPRSATEGSVVACTACGSSIPGR